MSIFDRLKRKGKKEFMKYEDGKIIPVKVEEQKNYKEFNINSGLHEDEIDIKTIIKEKVDMPGKVKRYGTFKTLKILGAIAIVVFLGFTIKDVYVAFSEPDKTTVLEETPSAPDKNKEEDKDTNETSSETGTYQPDSESISEVTPIISDDLKEEEPINKDETPLKSAIDASNLVNSLLVSETSKEVGNVNLYVDNKLNAMLFQKKAEPSLASKQELVAYLAERKDIFTEEDILSFYSLTEKRLDNSIDLTESILSSFVNDVSNDDLIEKINRFIHIENTLKKNQNKEFIKLLKDKNIAYTFDENKGEITYTID